MSNVIKQIQNQINKKKYMIVLPVNDNDYTTNDDELHYLKKNCQNQKLGDYFLIDDTVDKNIYGNHAEYSHTANYTVGDLIDNVLRIMSATIYQTKNGLILVPDDKVNIMGHKAYIIVHDDKLLNKMDFVTNPYSEGPYSIEAALLSYYLLHKKNLYWDGRQNQFKLHDKLLFNLIMPKFHKNQMKKRNHLKERILATMISAVRPVFKKFAYKHVNQFKTKSGVIEPECQQTSLFSKPRPKHNENMLPINPSKFIHQLAAVDCTNLFYVETKTDDVGQPKAISKVPKETSVSEMHLNKHTLSYDAKNDQSPFGIVKGKLKHGLWIQSPFEISQFFTSNIASSKSELKQSKDSNIITYSRQDAQRIASKFQEIHPDGCIYTMTQFGPHLYNIVFGSIKAPYENTRPTALIPAMLAMQIMDEPKSVNVNLISNHKHAYIFGNPKHVKFEFKRMSDLSEYYMNATAENIYILQPVYKVYGYDINKNLIAKWLKNNKAYSSFISKI